MAKPNMRSTPFDSHGPGSCKRPTSFSATFDFFESLIGMRRIATVAIPVLALLLMPGGASAARGRRAAPAKCRPGHSRQVSANADAQLYVATEPHAFPEYLGVYGCVYGQRPVFLGPLPYASSSGAGGVRYETLAGPFAAYQESSMGGVESVRSEWHVVVRNLRSGRVLYRVPTGQPLNPKSEHVGVGNIVSLVLKSNGSVAWVADDYGRSLLPNGGEVPYFDVYALDKTGMRLLAAGVDVDPGSLALSIGGTNIGMGSEAVAAGGLVYWTQGGKSFSAPLN
jgi:hypothetical protein